MPTRNTPFETGKYYHVFNRGVAKQNIFSTTNTYKRFLSCIDYYRFANPAIRLSDFLETVGDLKNSLLAQTVKGGEQVSILAYCLMPNHYHLLLKQLTENGISTFIRKSMNSFSSYFNILNERNGPLFQGPFKAVEIITNEQLIHVIRYILLNPYLSGLSDIKNVFTYPWSSIGAYTLGSEDKFVKVEDVLSLFKDKNSFKKFIVDEIDHKNSLLDFKQLYIDVD